MMRCALARDQRLDLGGLAGRAVLRAVIAGSCRPGRGAMQPRWQRWELPQQRRERLLGGAPLGWRERPA
jgi:hypothetical protein